MKRDCLVMKAQGRKNDQAQSSAPNPNTPKQNRLYALRSNGDQKDSPMLSPVRYKYFPLMSMLY